MNTLVMDASIVLKWILKREEQGVREATEMYQRMMFGTLRLVSPEIMLSEVVNVMFWKQAFSRADIVGFVGRLESSRIEIVPQSKFSWSKLLAVMDEYTVPAFDAYYVLLAKKLRCKLVTADRELINKIDWAVGVGDV